MFSSLRYFAIVCLLLVIGGSIGLSYYLSNNQWLQLQQTQGEQITATLGSYNAAIWQRYAPEIIPNPASPLLNNFLIETTQFFKGQPVAKVTLFSPDVQRLYFGSSNAYVAGSDSQRITLFDLPMVQSGKLVRRVLPKVYLKGGDSPETPRVLMQIIAPIMKPGATTPEALAEIYIDVSQPWHRLQTTQYIIIGTMIGTFTLMIGLLIFTAGRAEAIITKQHEVNLELTAAAAQAESQSHDKSQFLASVSHELRTPLNAIIGFSEILRNEAKQTLDKLYQDYVDDIYASGRHLLSLINDILDYSKAEAGKLQIEWAETDATKVIRNSLRMVLPRAETAQVTIVEDIPSHHLVIVTDAKKLKQVLLNLLSNAVKFTRAGGEVRCQAWTDVTTDALVIMVKDTGIGIAPKDISKVMTPFGQVDSVLSRKYEGTGLGLPLSKKFVESMGGTFAIASELNVGTTVTITIPKNPPAWSTARTSPVVTEEENDVAPTPSNHAA